MFTFEISCTLLEFFKIFTLSGFLGDFKNIKILGFLAHSQPAQAIFQRMLSLRRQFFSAGSACVGNFLAQAQHAQANCQLRLSVRKFIPCFDSFFKRTLNLRSNFLAHAQPAQAIFQRTLSLRRQFFSAHSAYGKNTKWRISAVVFGKKKKKKNSSPQVTYPYRIY